NGLQPYQFLIIENPEIRAQLREKSYNQSQITDASHLIVMCALNSIDEVYVDKYMDRSVELRGLNPADVEGYRNHLKNSVAKADAGIQLRSNAKQAYIALGQLLQTAAQLRIDATPMEGFSPEGYDEVLGLKEKNLTAVVVCALGFRSDEDAFQHLKKVRKPAEELFETI
ncbi:MAG: NAD(P)H-dependent oxidoreductase, partial [Crocinitomicaceae bacterium]